ncbi:PEP-CTERM sorting domain-containing protein [Aquisphaera insulae]|uniref:PEP-CTERM sorting domain-containing protein n=1 Tax=Aquisphaera insulae TaxID=2712864 RepID=UPI0013EBABD1|nr:PEP-CTERM sorting domain-containing protein [Aquisphaera insulae]
MAMADTTPVLASPIPLQVNITGTYGDGEVSVTRDLSISGLNQNHGTWNPYLDYRLPLALGVTYMEPHVIDSDFSLKIAFETGNPQDAPYIVLQGHAQGEITKGPTRNLSGQFTGTPTVAQVFNWMPDSSVPRVAIDAFTDLSLVRIQSFMSYGNEYGVFLYPSGDPAPVPEPTAFAVFGLGMGAYMLRRRMHRRG